MPGRIHMKPKVVTAKPKTWVTKENIRNMIDGHLRDWASACRDGVNSASLTVPENKDRVMIEWFEYSIANGINWLITGVTGKIAIPAVKFAVQKTQKWLPKMQDLKEVPKQSKEKTLRQLVLSEIDNMQDYMRGKVIVGSKVNYLHGPKVPLVNLTDELLGMFVAQGIQIANNSSQVHNRRLVSWQHMFGKLYPKGYQNRNSIRNKKKKDIESLWTSFHNEAERRSGYGRVPRKLSGKEILECYFHAYVDSGLYKELPGINEYFKMKPVKGGYVSDGKIISFPSGVKVTKP